jgi:hypothetical protein
MSVLPNDADPADIVDDGDYGAETQRRYGYQYAYGIMLLCNASRGNLDYRSLWCEHHEDFLAQCDGGTYDAYQIKTRKITLQPWKLTDPALKNTLRYFVRLHNMFGDKIQKFFFVSNMDLYDSSQLKETKKCLGLLLAAVQATQHPSGMSPQFQDILKTLAGFCRSSEDVVFSVLRRVVFAKGPSLEDFEDVVAHTHLSSLPELNHASASQLSHVRENVAQRIWVASTRQSPSPAKHWYCLRRDGNADPFLAEKQISLADFSGWIAEDSGPRFKFSFKGAPLSLTEDNRQLTRFERKLLQGGLLQELEIFRRRTLNAEASLMELQHTDACRFSEIRDHLVEAVEGDCADARTIASGGQLPYGKEMFRVLSQRLWERTQNNSRSVFNQEYECLVGIAGLLTEECRVWWSPEFDTGDAQ